MAYTSSKRTFTLRTLFVLVGVVGVWLGVEVNQARQQRNAVKAVLEAGGHVRYEHQRRLDESSAVKDGSLPGPRFRWLRSVIGDEFFQEVVEVGWNKKVKSDDLRWLAHFPKLDTVHLNFTNVDDEGLAHLANLHQLKTVDLEKCNGVTDVGLSHLATLRELEYLSLLATSCTDDGVRKHIPGLSKLTYLDLAGIPITHDTAMELCNLKHLHFVHLGRVGYRSTHDLSDAVASIRRQLPNCTINYWPPDETNNVQ